MFCPSFQHPPRHGIRLQCHHELRLLLLLLDKWAKTCGRLAVAGRTDTDYMAAECDRHMVGSCGVKDAQHVAVVSKFAERQVDMLAAGLNASCKARDLATGVISESQRLAIIANVLWSTSPNYPAMLFYSRSITLKPLTVT
jgi:hypothetical protein